ncbi:MAG: zinc ribbon domain-containing protein, partial [Acidimicrobiales bacterium]
RRLVTAKKKVKGKANLVLRDFDHQVARKAANHVIAHDTDRLVLGDVRGIEQKTRVERRMGRHGRQQLSQWSRGVQERYLSEATGLGIAHLNESGSTKTCPACLTRNRPSGRHYRCKNPDCGFTCHRDAVGSINIIQKALHGEYVPIDPETHIRVTYVRAVEGWSPDHRKAHRKVQSRKARALSSAQNRALTGVTQSSEPKLANSSTNPSSRSQASWPRWRDVRDARQSRPSGRVRSPVREGGEVHAHSKSTKGPAKLVASSILTDGDRG